MCTRGRQFSPVSAWKVISAQRILWSRSRALVALALGTLLGPAACTGSPATLELQPDFAVKTPNAIISVSIRESLPGMTDSEFEQLVRKSMARALPGHVVRGPVKPPFPRCRVVWHVEPTGPRAVSMLMVNIFDGSVPVAYEEDTVVNSAPTAALTYAIDLLTTQLLAPYAQADANSASDGCRPNRQH
jgi:hypothetical protein